MYDSKCAILTCCFSSLRKVDRYYLQLIKKKNPFPKVLSSLLLPLRGKNKENILSLNISFIANKHHC